MGPGRSKLWIVWPMSIVAPIVVAALLIPGRGHLNAANDALILVVVTVVISTFGSRMAAAMCAIASGASFDFFLTRPYGSLRISRQSDLVTEVLFVVVALIVGELATRSRHHQSAAMEGRTELARISAWPRGSPTARSRPLSLWRLRRNFAIS